MAGEIDHQDSVVPLPARIAGEGESKSTTCATLPWHVRSSVDILRMAVRTDPIEDKINHLLDDRSVQGFSGEE